MTTIPNLGDASPSSPRPQPQGRAPSRGAIGVENDFRSGLLGYRASKITLGPRKPGLAKARAFRDR